MEVHFLTRHMLHCRPHLQPPALACALQEGDAAAKQPEQEVAGQPIDTWTLPENTGRAYAALDGDISPMHLYKATAMLMGFPSPVANVHFLAARTEATIATTVGEKCVGPTRDVNYRVLSWCIMLNSRAVCVFAVKLSITHPQGCTARHHGASHLCRVLPCTLSTAARQFCLVHPGWPFL
jgi:hypothetical protein